MAVNSLRIDGIAELRGGLRQLTPDLVREAAAIIHAQAQAAILEIGAAYPIGPTGNLRRGLRLELHEDNVTAWAVVRSRARHAWLYEHGSSARRWASGKSTGTMPARGVFIPIAIQRRRMILSALIDLVNRAGLHVSGASA